jgi:hypothetical protein
LKLRLGLAALTGLILTALSCGVYTFSPSALGSVKTVAIPLFENETTESGLRERLTDQLAQAFVNDNTLKVVREQQADAILRGSVVSYLRDPYSFTQAEVVNEYICRIGLKVSFANRRSGKVIWEENGITNFGTYNAATETEEDGKARAIAKLVEDILNKTVKGW